MNFLAIVSGTLAVFNALTVPFYIFYGYLTSAFIVSSTTINSSSMFRYRQQLKSPFFTLSIHVGCVDILAILQHLFLITLPLHFYPEFV